MPYALPITLLAALAVSLALNAWIAAKLAAARIEAEDTAETIEVILAALKGDVAHLKSENTQLAGTVNWMRKDVDELAAIKVARRKSAKRASDASAAKRANGAAAAHAG